MLFIEALMSTFLWKVRMWLHNIEKKIEYMEESKAEAGIHKEEASKKRLLAIAEKLGDRELFPEQVARANGFLRRLALTDKRFTIS
jgi:hypothetical protein